MGLVKRVYKFTKDILQRREVTTAGAILSLNFQNAKQRIFYSDADLLAAKEWQLENDTNAMRFEFEFTITDVAHLQQLPASFQLSDAQFELTEAGKWTPPDQGTYLARGVKAGAAWDVQIHGPK